MRPVEQLENQAIFFLLPIYTKGKLPSISDEMNNCINEKSLIELYPHYNSIMLANYLKLQFEIVVIVFFSFWLSIYLNWVCVCVCQTHSNEGESVVLGDIAFLLDESMFAVALFTSSIQFYTFVSILPIYPWAKLTHLYVPHGKHTNTYTHAYIETDMCTHEHEIY